MLLSVMGVSIPVWCDLENDLLILLDVHIFCFNSSMVRFGVACTIGVLKIIGCFNSSMVRFGAFLISVFFVLIISFNSSMVRFGVSLPA